MTVPTALTRRCIRPGSMPGRGGGPAGRMPRSRPQEEPAEHLCFAAYLSKLEQVTDADETGLVSEVLIDPDQTMAQSVVLRHLDRGATDLHHGPAHEPWTESMTQATICYLLLPRRLREWSLLRAITLGRLWHQDVLLESSDWLQPKAALRRTPTPSKSSLSAGAPSGSTMPRGSPSSSSARAEP